MIHHIHVGGYFMTPRKIGDCQTLFLNINRCVVPLLTLTETILPPIHTMDVAIVHWCKLDLDSWRFKYVAFHPYILTHVHAHTNTYISTSVYMSHL